METDIDFWNDASEVYNDVKQYRKMIEKLIYLTITVTRLEIFFYC